MYEKLTEIKLNCLCASIEANVELSGDFLNGKEFSDDQVIKLAKALVCNTSVNFLQLFSIKLTQNGKNILLTALKDNKSIKYLFIKSSVDIWFILDLLNNNTTIEKLYLYDEIGNEGARNFFDGLAQKDSIIADIYLQDPNIDPLYLDAIKDMQNFNRRFSFSKMDHVLNELGFNDTEEEFTPKGCVEFKKLRANPQQTLLQAKKEKLVKIAEWNKLFENAVAQKLMLEKLLQLLEKLEKLIISSEELKEKREQLEKKVAENKAEVVREETRQFELCMVLQLFLGLSADCLLSQETPNYSWKSLIGFTTIGLLAGGINVKYNNYEDKDAAKEFYFAQKSTMIGYAFSLAASSALSIENAPMTVGTTLACGLGFYKLHHWFDQRSTLEVTL